MTRLLGLHLIPIFVSYGDARTASLVAVTALDEMAVREPAPIGIDRVPSAAQTAFLGGPSAYRSLEYRCADRLNPP